MLVGAGWSVTFKIDNKPEKYFSTALNPKSNYNHPDEWAGRKTKETIFGSTVTVIDYRRITQEEYDLFYEKEVKPKVAAYAATLCKEMDIPSYGI